MTLGFGAASSNQVDCGSAPALDDLPTMTVWAWVYPSAFVANMQIMSKSSNGVGSGWSLQHSGTAGAIDFRLKRATTNAIATSNTLALTLRRWWFVVGLMDRNGSPICRIFRGAEQLQVQEFGYGTQQDGSGSVTADQSRNLGIGNIIGQTNVYNGLIAGAGVSNALLTLGEMDQVRLVTLRDLATRGLAPPRNIRGLVAYWRLGREGAVLQPDVSGNANHGTVTGATVWPAAPQLGKRRVVRDEVKAASGSNVYTVSGSGGAVAGGGAARTLVLPRTAAGGDACSGAAAQTKVLPRTAAGGAVCGGAASKTRVLPRASSGGATASGAASRTLVLQRTGGGTGVVGGGGSVGGVSTKTGSGGATCSGSGAGQVTRTRTGSGGATTGGAAARVLVFPRIGAGGGLCGGGAARSVVFYRLGAGTVLVGSAAAFELAGASNAPVGTAVALLGGGRRVDRAGGYRVVRVK